MTFTRAGTTAVIQQMPADLGDNCGEYYLSEEMTDRVLAVAEAGLRKGAEIEVLRWAA